MSNEREWAGDAASVDSGTPVADADPPSASGAEPLRPSAPPTEAPGDPSSAGEGNDETASAASSVLGEGVVDADESEESALESEIEADIRELAAERDTFRDLAQRTLADFENYKKRVRAQIHDEAERAAARMADALLPVLDAAEAAYVRHPDEIGPLLNLMLGELRKQGLETLDLEGRPFDPHLADAVAHEPGDGGEVVVAEVLRSGYRWKDRTLRAAMVRTADRAPAPAGADEAPAADES